MHAGRGKCAARLRDSFPRLTPEQRSFQMIQNIPNGPTRHVSIISIRWLGEVFAYTRERPCTCSCRAASPSYKYSTLIQHNDPNANPDYLLPCIGVCHLRCGLDAGTTTYDGTELSRGRKKRERERARAE